MTYQITEMTKADHAEASALWQRIPGIGLSDADSSCAIGRFLDRNPGLCFVARQGETMVGTCLAGSDGRRGYLYHLAVDSGSRRLGIGQALVEKSFAGLKALGIQKCHIMVFADNVLGLAFWQASGWKLRKDIEILSYDLITADKDSPC
jgi:ribosomal protein S18 acetylase RimI-like enzyme